MDDCCDEKRWMNSPDFWVDVLHPDDLAALAELDGTHEHSPADGRGRQAAFDRLWNAGCCEETDGFRVYITELGRGVLALKNTP